MGKLFKPRKSSDTHSDTHSVNTNNAKGVWAQSALFAPLLISPFLVVRPGQAAPLSPTPLNSAAIAPSTRSLQPLGQMPSPPLPPLGAAEAFLPKPDPQALIHLQIRLSERRVYVYSRDKVQASFPVAIGRAGWETPKGSYHVLQKIENPAWQHPFTGEIIPPGADNPLGTRWIGFWTDGTNFIGFHGTPNAESVGRPASHGCIRMYGQDVTKLFELVRIGTPVDVVP